MKEKIRKMSIRIKLSDIEDNIKEEIQDELKFRPEIQKFSVNNRFQKQGEYVYPYELDIHDNVYLPYAYALGKLSNIEPPKISDFPKIDVKFTKTLREGQKQILPEFSEKLNRKGCIKLACYPGWGKTCFANYLSTKIKLKTLIIVHRSVLVDQWKESILNFVDNPKIQILKTGKEIKPDTQYLITTAGIVENFRWKFSEFGLVIVDEIHTIATKSLSTCLKYITPRFLIGLSATPTRPDGMDKLLDVYFGEDCIYRKLTRSHLYYGVKTNLTPEFEVNEKGELIWNSILEWQSKSEERNQIILDIIEKHKDRHFLVLCKRIEHAQYLLDKLKEMGERVDSMIGSGNTFDKNARVLIVTIQKCGVGFSHDILDSLIIASDCEEYFVQYLGRVMRTEVGTPIVFDLVDEHPSLKRHFSTRKKVSKEAGGEFKNYK